MGIASKLGIGCGGALPPWVALLGPAGAAEIGLSNTSLN